jgi:hypothetical protein
VNIEQSYQAVRQSAFNALAQLKAAAGNLEKAQQIVRVEGLVHAAPGFHEHPKVLDGASELSNAVRFPFVRHRRAC